LVFLRYGEPVLVDIQLAPAVKSSASSMGNFYVNYTLRGPEPEVVVTALKGRSAIVTPKDKGSVVVFDAEAESQDLGVFDAVGRGLSTELRCPVLAVLNHDDDVLLYRLFDDGELLDDYNSAPAYPTPSVAPSGGNAELLCKAFEADNPSAVSAILQKPQRGGPDGYLFAVHRHLALVEALGLSVFAVGAGFSQVSADDAPNGVCETDLLFTP